MNFFGNDLFEFISRLSCLQNRLATFAHNPERGPEKKSPDSLKVNREADYVRIYIVKNPVRTPLESHNAEIFSNRSPSNCKLS